MHNPLLAPTACLLQQRTDSVSEYALIGLLKKQCDFIPDAFAGDALSLFRTHFLLFNALYQLQLAWLDDQTGYLTIDALCIQLIPYKKSSLSHLQHLNKGQSEPLKAYYLDITNLTGTNRNDVDALLGAFWKKYAGSTHRMDALFVLGLEDPVTMLEIKQAYRRKAMKHHPDRGGSDQALQEVNGAMEQLKNYYR